MVRATLGSGLMCSLCGALGKGPAWEQATMEGDDSARWRLRRESVKTAQLVTDLLGTRRIKITANPNHGYIVAFPTGGSEVAASLADIWHLLSRRGIPVPDPLASV
jgi:hypothetical protein